MDQYTGDFANMNTVKAELEDSEDCREAGRRAGVALSFSAVFALPGQAVNTAADGSGTLSDGINRALFNL